MHIEDTHFVPCQESLINSNTKKTLSTKKIVIFSLSLCCLAICLMLYNSNTNLPMLPPDAILSVVEVDPVSIVDDLGGVARDINQIFSGVVKVGSMAERFVGMAGPIGIGISSAMIFVNIFGKKKDDVQDAIDQLSRKMDETY